MEEEEEPTKRDKVAQAAKGAAKTAAKKAIKKYLLQALAGAGAGYVVGCLIIILLVAAGFGLALYLSGETPAIGTPTVAGLYTPLDPNDILNASMNETPHDPVGTATGHSAWAYGACDWFVPNKSEQEVGIYAIADGKIITAGYQAKTGTYYSYFESGDGKIKAVYAHITSINEGRIVKKGEKLGTLMYLKSGAHLHFELQIDGKDIGEGEQFEFLKNIAKQILGKT